MNTKLILERVLIMAILLLAILQVGGLAVRADLDCQPDGMDIEAPRQWLSERLCQMIGFPHSNGEACGQFLRMVD